MDEEAAGGWWKNTLKTALRGKTRKERSEEIAGDGGLGEKLWDSIPEGR